MRDECYRALLAAADGSPLQVCAYIATEVLSAALLATVADAVCVDIQNTYRTGYVGASIKASTYWLCRIFFHFKLPCLLSTELRPVTCTRDDREPLGSVVGPKAFSTNSSSISDRRHTQNAYKGLTTSFNCPSVFRFTILWPAA